MDTDYLALRVACLRLADEWFHASYTNDHVHNADLRQCAQDLLLVIDRDRLGTCEKHKNIVIDTDGCYICNIKKRKFLSRKKR